MSSLDRFAQRVRVAPQSDGPNEDGTGSALHWVQECEQAMKARREHYSKLAKYMLLVAAGVLLFGGALAGTLVSLLSDGGTSDDVELRYCTPAPVSKLGFCPATTFPTWDTKSAFHDLAMTMIEASISSASFYQLSFGMNRASPSCALAVQEMTCNIARAPCNGTAGACSHIKPCVST